MHLFTILTALLLTCLVALAQIDPNWTPAERAAATGDLPTLTRLTQQGADLRIHKGNPLVLAVQRKQTEVLTFLLEQGVLLDKTHPSYKRVWKKYFEQLIPISHDFYLQGQSGPGALACEQLRDIYGEEVSRQDETYATLLNNLAELYRSLSQYEKALPLYQDCKAIQEKVLGNRHSNYAITLNNLAGLYKDMGQYEEALPLYKDCKAILEQAQGKNHPDYASILNNMAQVYESMSQYEKALPLFQEALIIHKKVKGKNHPDYASTLNNLANLYNSMGQYEKALPLFLEDIAITEKVRGKNHPDYGNTLSNLAKLYESMGQYEKAILLFQEDLSITEKAQGKTHPAYATTLNNLAGLYELMGQYEKALPLHLEARQQYRTQLLSQIGIINEAAIRLFQQKFDYSEFVYSLGYTAQNQALAEQHYADALLSKGIGLLAGQHLNTVISQTKDTTAHRLAAQFRAIRMQLNRQLDLPLNQQQGVDALQKQATNLEQQLIRQLPEYGRAFEAIRVEWPQVQQALQPDEAAIEFVTFRYFHKRFTDSTCYMALLLRPGWEVPKVVRLGEQRQLDVLLTANPGPAQINNLYRGGVVSSTPGQSQQAQGLALSRFIWQPLDSLLQGAKTVYVAPAGRLHQIALAALPNPADTSQRMADRFTIWQVGSTRIVAIRHQRPSQPLHLNERPATLYGGIQYEADSLQLRQQAHSDNADHRLAYREATRSGVWNYLTGTQTEVEQIQRLLSPTQTRTLTGLDASEQSLKALSGRAPAVLHIATHGFFFPDLEQSKTEPGLTRNRFEVSEDPLLRSGLIMAGANYVWKGGKPIEGVDDGILTASEVSALNLLGTELVVMSACETALGKVQGSEGVYGLQRSFKMAGVRYLLMSLWRVSDKETADYMTLFYRQLLKTGSVPTAYGYAQQQMRQQYPGEPYKWAAFVLIE